MERAEAVLEWVNGRFFGVALPMLLFFAGLLYALCLRGFPFIHPLRTLRLGLGGGKTARHALTMALSGTLGVGNVAGVALAIAYGGPGAVFWMWISALISTFLKYAEIVLALCHRRKSEEGFTGGAMYYMRRAAEGRMGRAGAFFFAVLCVFTAFCLGGLVQSASAAESLSDAFALPPAFSGLLLLFISAPVVCGGAKRIASFTARLIPLLSGLYLFLALWAILGHLDGMGGVLGRILSDAVRVESGGAGVLAFLSSRALRYGVSRGLLSHEAGAGTAPMAHATADNTPAAQGILGIFEVLIDTFVFCTLTAFVLLLAYPEGVPLLGGMELMNGSFLALTGRAAPPLLAISVFLFAYATVISWCYYGKCAVAYLSPRRGVRGVYLFFYLLSLPLGTMLSGGLVWHLTDTVLSALTMLHALFLLPMVGEVRAVTRSSGLIGGKERRKGAGYGKIRLGWGEKADFLSRRGKRKGKTQSMEQSSFSLLAATVKPISQKGVSDGGHMHANLVGAAGKKQ